MVNTLWSPWFVPGAQRSEASGGSVFLVFLLFLVLLVFGLVVLIGLSGPLNLHGVQVLFQSGPNLGQLLRALFPFILGPRTEALLLDGGSTQPDLGPDDLPDHLAGKTELLFEILHGHGRSSGRLLRVLCLRHDVTSSLGASS